MSALRSPHRKHDREYFYKYVTLDIAKKIIGGRKLRWSSPLLFNDPFDVPQEAKFDFTVRELQEAVIEEFLRALQDGQNLSNPRIQFLSYAFRTDTNEARRRAVVEAVRSLAHKIPDLEPLRVAWKEYVPGLRILCLSEVNDSPPMWLHYSDNHRGAVLKFTCSDEMDSSLLLAQPVIYRDALPSLPSKEVWGRSIVRDEPMDWQQYFREYYYVKMSAWAQEKEWRVISYAPGQETETYSDELFQPGELAAVYLGTEVSDADATAVMEVLVDDLRHVELYRARLERQERKIIFDRPNGKILHNENSDR